MLLVSELNEASAKIDVDRIAEDICNNFILNHPEYEGLYNPKEKTILVKKIGLFIKNQLLEYERELETYCNQTFQQTWSEIIDEITHIDPQSSSDLPLIYD